MSQFVLRQCSYWAQLELVVVDWGLQARGRDGEHWWLKVFGVECGGKVASKEGGRLRGAGRGRFRRDRVSRGGAEDLWLKLQELTHEAEVGRDDVPTLLDDVKSRVQPQLLRPHDVGHADCWRARDACFTVDQHLPPRLLHIIWEERKTSMNFLYSLQALWVWQPCLKYNPNYTRRAAVGRQDNSVVSLHYLQIHVCAPVRHAWVTNEPQPFLFPCSNYSSLFILLSRHNNADA